MAHRDECLSHLPGRDADYRGNGRQRTNEMQTAMYRFIRRSSISGFLSQNRPSTDAIKALEQCSSRLGRNYEVLVDEDDVLVARLSWEDGDREAGPDLDRQCSEVGVNRAFEPE